MNREDDFSRLELDLGNCEKNYRYFRSLLEPQTKLLVLVKANAYGHGAVEFAAMMQRAGADYLAVAYPVEGHCAASCGKRAAGTSPSTSNWTPGCTGSAS